MKKKAKCFFFHKILFFCEKTSLVFFQNFVTFFQIFNIFIFWLLQVDFSLFFIFLNDSFNYFFVYCKSRDKVKCASIYRPSKTLNFLHYFRQVNDIVESLGLSNCLDTLANKLSGGERKRLSIGVEMITKPSVFLLDEPTSGLDSVASNQVGYDNVITIILQEYYSMYTRTLIKKSLIFFYIFHMIMLKSYFNGDISTAH